MAGIGFNLSQQQRQIMTLAPQMRQSLEMLQMPVMALKEAIIKEMAVNPTVEMTDEIDTLPPPNGFTTMTEETKKLLGFGGLIWTGAPVPVPGWAQVGAVAMKITDLTLTDPQSMRVRLQLTGPESEVRFDPSVPAGNFSALPVVLEKDEGVPPAETPAAVQVDGGRATLTLPKGENPKTKLFRILYSSRRR